MSKYKVTIHEHKIYDMYIEAPSLELAEEDAEEIVISDDRSLWRPDELAGWTEIGEIEDVGDIELLDED